MQIVSILIIILAIYLILNHLGWLNIFNIFPTIENTVELPFLFIIGLLTSVHCIAMCGGINLTQSVNAAQKQDKTLKTSLLYNLGRVISYTLIGGIAGAVGSVLSFKGIVAVIAGAVMLLMALRMLGVFKSLRKLRLPIPKNLRSSARNIISRAKSKRLPTLRKPSGIPLRRSYCMLSRSASPPYGSPGR
ncbi:MAG: sulfite exporter TauE/SafE family protein [Ruminococcus sp.]|nr:sulfite exporter TauE/SafE family protein [Ruminococcus sp.]